MSFHHTTVAGRGMRSMRTKAGGNRMQLRSLWTLFLSKAEISLARIVDLRYGICTTISRTFPLALVV